jgi:DNA-binding transcriptional ArsR family regulator
LNTVFKALNDPTRRAILEMLRERDLAAGEIAAAFDMAKPSISHHLDLLRQAGLVEARKEGQFVMYSLSTSVLEDLIHWMLSLSRTTSTDAEP